VVGFFIFDWRYFLFKGKLRMYISVKQEGTRRGTLNVVGTGGQKGGMFG
jgi:hypothetical protein